MEKTFLSKEQISKLEEMQWDVIPNCAYIQIYLDDLPYTDRVDLCQTLDVDINVDHVRILAIAKQVPND
jgi:hypothetical protein